MSDKGSNPSLKVLICGGGIAGPALAHELARHGHRVTVIERFPALRASGAQVDLRGQGIDAAERMGFLGAIRDRLVEEDGVAFVDANGRTRATIMANRSGEGAQTLTSEYEIMRGDLVRLLYEATKDSVTYAFDISVERFDDDEDAVRAHFSDGTSDRFDLLVGADGQGSRIRQAILPAGADPYLRMGIHMSYWFVPRTSTDDGTMRQTYLGSRGRMIMRRSHNPTETQVYFVLRERSEEASAIHRAPLDEQKRFWARRFADAGWQTGRFIEGMMAAPDFYSQEVVQVRTDTWSKGRVVLLGDAAHCASPFSGMGVSGALVGAYVLANEIQRHPTDLASALANYDKTLRPFVDEIQNVKPWLLRLGMPRTRVGVRLFLSAMGIASKLNLPERIARISSEDRGGAWRLPDRDELP